MGNDFIELWQKVLSIVRPRINDQSYETWFLPLEIHAIDENSNIIYFRVNEEASKKIQEGFIIKIIQTRYTSLIEDCIFEVSQNRYKVVIKSIEEYKENPVEQTFTIKKEILTAERQLNKQRIMNPKYRFDNFIMGDSNRFACVAAKAVAEAPSMAFNPLFIYGGSGLGKTHLMHAIGIYLTENNPDMNILYVSSEMFTNEFITALRENKIPSFIKKYRQVDVLMIDDIQFLEGKERTQEEFFHTFTALHSANKQIVISSDKPPNKLENLHERLTSRFGSSMVAEIQPADFETRCAILQKYVELHKTQLIQGLDDDINRVIEMVAERVTDNIRELEGAMNRLIGFSTVLGEKIDVPFAKRMLQDILTTGGKNITPEKIKTVVSRYFNIQVSDLESKVRKDSIAHPRQIAMYLCRTKTDYTQEKIGSLFGRRHYSTVIHACDKVKNEIEMSEAMRETIEELIKEIEK